MEDRPVYSFGLIADIQYADLDNGRSGWKRPRYYRDSINKLKSAISSWERESIDIAFNLGDSIDRASAHSKSKSPLECLQTVAETFQTFSGSIHSVLGNHDLFVFQKEEAIQTLGIHTRYSHLNLHELPEEEREDMLGRAYYEVDLCPGWKVLALDTYDLCHESSLQHKRSAAGKLFQEKRRQVGSPSSVLLGREFPDCHLVNFNGGVGSAQLSWLEQRLTQAQKNGDRVIIVTHAPLWPEVAYGPQDAVCWNFDEVLNILHRFTKPAAEDNQSADQSFASSSSSTVVACFYGHEHMGGGPLADTGGVHHCALEAALEGPLGSDAHAIVHIFADRLELRGFGSVRSGVMPFI